MDNSTDTSSLMMYYAAAVSDSDSGQDHTLIYLGIAVAAAVSLMCICCIVRWISLYGLKIPSREERMKQEGRELVEKGRERIERSQRWALDGEQMIAKGQDMLSQADKDGEKV